MIRRWSPAGVGAPLAQYQHLAAAPADHELLFISGQVGTRPDGTFAGADAESQTRQIFANLEALLDSAGAFADRGGRTRHTGDPRRGRGLRRDTPIRLNVVSVIAALPPDRGRYCASPWPES